MKGIYITLITIMSILAIALVSLLGFAIYNGGDFITFGPIERIEQNIQKDEKYSMEDIEKLEINFVSADAYIYTTDEEELRIVQYANKKLDQDRLYQMESNDKTLFMKDGKTKVHFGFFVNYSTVYEIFIPKDYCENIHLKTVSGDIIIEDNLCSSNLNIESTSGDIEASNTLDAIVNIKTVSGEIDLQTIKGDTILKTTSGDVKANTIEGNTAIHTTSGDMGISSLKGSINLETTSGSIKINHVELQDDSKIRTVSGDVDLALKNTNCEIRTKTTSGDVRLPNGSSLVGTSPEHILEIKTTSGDITID